MSNILAIETIMPVEAPDSPISEQLAKRGHINVGTTTEPVNVYYEIYGSGSEKVVLVNGMGADRQMWEPDVAEFLKRGNYQCLVYDHRGTGFSDSTIGLFSYTSSSMAADLKVILDTLGWTKTNLVGASMGGMISLEFACNHTDMVNTLTLVVTHAGLTLPPWKGIMDSVYSNFQANSYERFRGICGSLYTKEYLESPAPADSGCENMLEYCAVNALRRSKYSKPMPFMSFLGQVGVVFRHYVSPARLELLGKLLPNKQILVVTGDHDHMVKTSNSDYIADKIGRDKVIFEVFEKTGHGLHAQEATRLVSSIDSMITAVNAN
ncbi:hypothetical protein J3B02_003308 [Coemansia erecta]|uniref:AB hydrolase-1 domain-containing protein n=1 Tax=Coemansia asiatica TaxID=1052880 RepID=A0A9W8CKW2_9FUNG|nr:hypothetical protein LPJ64_001142 [Coemansia asiatica]KAJ2853055.1 hypothetical protein J3B02_003308 [Coemansia erecta]KAJ2880344.1 hypothetical protein FB639_002857 [Coemansia asiatica]